MHIDELAFMYTLQFCMRESPFWAWRYERDEVQLRQWSGIETRTLCSNTSTLLCTCVYLQVHTCRLLVRNYTQVVCGNHLSGFKGRNGMRYSCHSGLEWKQRYTIQWRIQDL